MKATAEYPYAVVEVTEGLYGKVYKTVDEYKTEDAARRDKDRMSAEPSLCFHGPLKVIKVGL